MTLLHPWALLLLPLAAIPWLIHTHPVALVATTDLLPRDGLAQWLDKIYKAIASLIIAVILLLLGFPNYAETAVTRSGIGAHSIILLDRSRSMDAPFRNSNDATSQPTLTRGSAKSRSKSEVAKDILRKFVSKRAQDRFGMTVFSTKPIRTLPITNKPEIINAAIDAGDIGSGLAETNIGSALIGALNVYQGEPYTGSRNILLISDGGDALSTPVKAKIKGLLQQHRVSLFWIFIRSHNAVAIDTNNAFSPHIALNSFFKSLNTPYKLYTAEHPDDLERAVRDVSRIQTQPVLYQEIIPRREASRALYWLLLSLLCCFLMFNVITVSRR